MNAASYVGEASAGKAAAAYGTWHCEALWTSVSIFTAQQSGCECASQTRENQKGQTHHHQAQCHHQRETLWALQIFKHLLRLRVGASRGGLLNGLQQSITQLSTSAEDQHSSGSKDRENAKP